MLVVNRCDRCLKDALFERVLPLTALLDRYMSRITKRFGEVDLVIRRGLHQVFTMVVLGVGEDYS